MLVAVRSMDDYPIKAKVRQHMNPENERGSSTRC